MRCQLARGLGGCIKGGSGGVLHKTVRGLASLPATGLLAHTHTHTHSELARLRHSKAAFSINRTAVTS